MLLKNRTRSKAQSLRAEDADLCALFDLGPWTSDLGLLS